MSKTRTRESAGRVSKKPRSAADASDEVTANQVLDTLLDLFKDLGVNASNPTSSANTVGKLKTASHTLYPYTSAIGEMLTYWHQHPEYLDEKGNPARIKLGGKRPSFRNLAQLKAPTIDVSYLLSELERLGAVSIDESKLISVHMRSFPVYEDKRLAVQHTLSTLDGFIKTLRHNLDSSPLNSDQLFHRIAWNNDFDIRKLQTLKIRARKHGQTFLESFDDWLMRNTLPKARKSNNRSRRIKVSIGVYLSVENS